MACTSLGNQADTQTAASNTNIFHRNLDHDVHAFLFLSQCLTPQQQLRSYRGGGRDNDDDEISTNPTTGKQWYTRIQVARVLLYVQSHRQGWIDIPWPLVTQSWATGGIGMQQILAGRKPYRQPRHATYLSLMNVWLF